MKRITLAFATGVSALLVVFAPAASAANKVPVRCSDGTSYSVGAAATFGQTVANTAFNSVNPLGITCSVD